MDQDLLPYLLAAFPAAARAANDDPDDQLIIRGYRIPADALDGRLLALLQAGPTGGEAARAA